MIEYSDRRREGTHQTLHIRSRPSGSRARQEDNGRQLVRARSAIGHIDTVGIVVAERGVALILGLYEGR
jgi:hypothetical protein